MLLKVIDAKYVSDYTLDINFNDGLNATVDLKDSLDGEVFEPLKNLETFKNFTQNRWTIGWDCGADFAPEYLHELALNQKDSFQEKVLT